MTKDLTTGKIMPILVNFTVPLVLGNLFQLTYNAVDSIIVGRFVGKEALAAVGICNPISTLMILFLKKDRFAVFFIIKYKILIIIISKKSTYFCTDKKNKPV